MMRTMSAKHAIGTAVAVTVIGWAIIIAGMWGLCRLLMPWLVWIDTVGR